MKISKSHFEQLLSKIYANSFCKNNQKVCIDCLNPRSNKNKFECKNYGCIDFGVLDYQNSLFQIIYKMAVLTKVKPCSDAVGYFKEVLFYNKLIKKPKAKRLKNIDRLVELPFYEQISVIKADEAFKGYVMSYKVEIIEKRDRILQLEASKLSIKDFLNDLLNETKGLKYQNTAKVLLKQCKLNAEIEFASVYFYSVTKADIYDRFRLKSSFQKILYMTDAWINNGFSWNVQSTESHTLIFQLVDHYQEVFIWTYLLN